MLRSVSGSIALPTQARQASETTPAPVDRLKSHVRWTSTSIAWSITPPWSTAPSIPHGVVTSWRLS